MTKNECIELFNNMIRGTPVSFQDKLLPMVSEFLTENNIENSEKMINLIVQNPQLIRETLPEVVDYYCRKFCILSLREKVNESLLNNFKTILYYE
jgi:predicted house-cleaning noncanonical NTP pyrophosphatase (MazG superfamily)